MPNDSRISAVLEIFTITVMSWDWLGAAILPTPSRKRPRAGDPGFGGMAAFGPVSSLTPIVKML
jgi:hypothetical protein